MDCDEYKPTEYDECMLVDTFKNGNDLLIKVKNMNLYPPEDEKDDEKSED